MTLKACKDSVDTLVPYLMFVIMTFKTETWTV